MSAWTHYCCNESQPTRVRVCVLEQCKRDLPVCVCVLVSSEKEEARSRVYTEESA